MKTCNDCKNRGKKRRCDLYTSMSTYAEKCKDFEEKKQTNADRIRSMGDEDLTKIIMCPYDTAGKPIEIMPCAKDGIQELWPPEDCKKCMMEWLQQEVEE